MPAAKKKKDAAPSENISREIISVPKFELIPPGWIVVRDNVRSFFSNGGMDELYNSIKAQGILQPLILNRITGVADEHVLISGERRLRAAIALNLEDVPCMIYDDLTPERILQIMLTENMLREDLTPIDEALGFRRALDLGITQNDLADKIGKSQSFVANRVRLIEDDTIREMIENDVITPGHAMKLLAYKQYPIWEEMIDAYLTNRLETINENGQGLPISRIDEELEHLFDCFDGTPYDPEDPDNNPLYADIDFDDFPECKSCEHSYGDMCLKPGCYADKEKAFEKPVTAVADQTAASRKFSSWEESDWLKASPDVALPSGMSSIGFCYRDDDMSIYSRPVRISECQASGCSHLNFENRICNDPVCFKQKYKDGMKKQKVASKRLRADIEGAMRATVHTMTEEELVSVVLKNIVNDFERQRSLRDSACKIVDMDERAVRSMKLPDQLRLVVLSWFLSEYGYLGPNDFLPGTERKFSAVAERKGLDTYRFNPDNLESTFTLPPSEESEEAEV